MTMRLVAARRVGSDFQYRVHLDTTRVVPDQSDDTTTVPDPTWVLEHTFGAGPRGSGETAAQYAARLTAFEAGARNEMRLLAGAALAAAQARETPKAGVALSGEGTDI